MPQLPGGKGKGKSQIPHTRGGLSKPPPILARSGSFSPQSAFFCSPASNFVPHPHQLVPSSHANLVNIVPTLEEQVPQAQHSLRIPLTVTTAAYF
uniref:Uncharacterized protein n=1 Tax=Physcomitrium patens TaxID=3218 RepID=A0A2K1J1F7_PHYPA|nr:hypothetical protein PHYPA_023263 [Physcomitrium patens]